MGIVIVPTPGVVRFNKIVAESVCLARYWCIFSACGSPHCLRRLGPRTGRNLGGSFCSASFYWYEGILLLPDRFLTGCFLPHILACWRQLGLLESTSLSWATIGLPVISSFSSVFAVSWPWVHCWCLRSESHTGCRQGAVVWGRGEVYKQRVSQWCGNWRARGSWWVQQQSLFLAGEDSLTPSSNLSSPRQIPPGPSAVPSLM